MAADLATLQARLVEAEAALHALMTGSRVQVVARDGRRLEYTSSAASVDKLTDYITSLESQIAALTGVDSTNPALLRRAGRFMFL